MNIDGNNDWINPAGRTYTWQSNTFPHTLGAVNQTVELPSGFYNTRLNHWSNGNMNYSISIQILSQDYIAFYDKQCTLNFTNLIEGGSHGTININGTVYSAPSPQFDVWSNNTITATAINQDYNNFHYTFTQWDDGPTSNPRTITPERHKTYTAQFSGKPIYTTSMRGLTVNEVMNQPLHLSWSSHPNSNVTNFRIYRGVGSTANAVLIATVSSSTLSFNDPDYIYNGQRNYNLYYDVRAYSSGFGTESDPAFSGPYFGGELYKQNSFADIQTYENSLDNFPNPFNPSTQINYSIKENGFVSIKIYDILGNKVANLMNEFKPAGSYSINFDASNLPSGIYISTIKSGNYSASKKMLLVK